MVKIVFSRKDSSKTALKSIDKHDVDDHKAIHLVTSHRKSNAYKETISANIPATYVSGRNVVKEIDGKRIVLKPISHSVSVKMMVNSMKPISTGRRVSCESLSGTLIVHDGVLKKGKKTSVCSTSEKSKRSTICVKK